ncbi:hypothetical protein [Paenibacillus sp. FSL H8-0168]|uniref:hypothetical protein n=1 Tax=Paenibacillus sp. FSL H8-0168 TaxID=2921378 RepID=UPI0031597560
MSERTINLPDGLEPMSEEDLKTIWNKADDARGDQAHLSDDVFDLVNALDAAYAQIDSLQQQAAGLNEESLANFRTAAERGKQMAERDRTIDRLRKSLEATVIPFKFYADPNTYDPVHLDKLGYIIIDEDGGASAKAALAAVLKALGRE